MAISKFVPASTIEAWHGFDVADNMEMGRELSIDATSRDYAAVGRIRTQIDDKAGMGLMNALARVRTGLVWGLLGVTTGFGQL
jgi:hypothetical protein